MDFGHNSVIKKNHLSHCDGICTVKCDDLSTKKCDLNTVLHLSEAFGNNVENETVGEFMKFCEWYAVGEILIVD